MSSVVDMPRGHVVSLFGFNTSFGYRELVIPIRSGIDSLCLHVTHGPSMDGESIHCWLDKGYTDQVEALVTIDALLDRCAIIRDGLHLRPCARIGDARFVISEEYAQLLEREFRFPATFFDD